jgi:hypothetical protein
MTVLPLMTIPQPDPLSQPTPTWLAWFLLVLTFFLHLLPMNIVLGGSIIAAVARMRGRGGERPHHAALAHWFGKAMPVAVAAAVTFGVAPLLFLQVLYGRLFFTSTILMGWFWLAVIAILILAYYGAYLLAFKGERLGGAQGPVSWIAALIFLAIGFVFTNNMTLMLRPGTFVERYLADGRGLHLNLSDPTLFPRYLHFALGAIAVSGILVALLGLLRRGSDPAFGGWAVRHGMLWFSIPTAINVVFGMVLLIALPRETMLRFMGGDLVATISLAAGVLLALVALILGFLSLQAKEPGGMVKGAFACLILTIVGMILNRDQVRAAALEAAGFEPNAWIAPQWGPIAIFFVLLVAALATVAWMVVALARGKGGAGSVT